MLIDHRDPPQHRPPYSSLYLKTSQNMLWWEIQRDLHSRTFAHWIKGITSIGSLNDPLPRGLEKAGILEILSNLKTKFNKLL